MQIILESDEAWGIMTLVVARVLDSIDLSDNGKAAVRKWRSEHAEGTERMYSLAEKMNEALGTVLEERTKRLIRRKGRYVSSLDPR